VDTVQRNYNFEGITKVNTEPLRCFIYCGLRGINLAEYSFDAANSQKLHQAIHNADTIIQAVDVGSSINIYNDESVKIQLASLHDAAEALGILVRKLDTSIDWDNPNNLLKKCSHINYDAQSSADRGKCTCGPKPYYPLGCTCGGVADCPCELYFNTLNGLSDLLMYYRSVKLNNDPEMDKYLKMECIRLVGEIENLIGRHRVVNCNVTDGEILRLIAEINVFLDGIGGDIKCPPGALRDLQVLMAIVKGYIANGICPEAESTLNIILNNIEGRMDAASADPVNDFLTLNEVVNWKTSILAIVAAHVNCANNCFELDPNRPGWPKSPLATKAEIDKVKDKVDLLLDYAKDYSVFMDPTDRANFASELNQISKELTTRAGFDEGGIFKTDIIMAELIVWGDALENWRVYLVGISETPAGNIKIGSDGWPVFRNIALFNDSLYGITSVLKTYNVLNDVKYSHYTSTQKSKLTNLLSKAEEVESKFNTVNAWSNGDIRDLIREIAALSKEIGAVNSDGLPIRVLASVAQKGELSDIVDFLEEYFEEYAKAGITTAFNDLKGIVSAVKTSLSDSRFTHHMYWKHIYDVKAAVAAYNNANPNNKIRVDGNGNVLPLYENIEALEKLWRLIDILEECYTMDDWSGSQVLQGNLRDLLDEARTLAGNERASVKAINAMIVRLEFFANLLGLEKVGDEYMPVPDTRYPNLEQLPSAMREDARKYLRGVAEVMDGYRNSLSSADEAEFAVLYSKAYGHTDGPFAQYSTAMRMNELADDLITMYKTWPNNKSIEEKNGKKWPVPVEGRAYWYDGLRDLIGVAKWNFNKNKDLSRSQKSTLDTIIKHANDTYTPAKLEFTSSGFTTKELKDAHDLLKAQIKDMDINNDFVWVIPTGPNVNVGLIIGMIILAIVIIAIILFVLWVFKRKRDGNPVNFYFWKKDGGKAGKDDTWGKSDTSVSYSSTGTSTSDSYTSATGSSRSEGYGSTGSSGYNPMSSVMTAAPSQFTPVTHVPEPAPAPRMVAPEVPIRPELAAFTTPEASAFDAKKPKTPRSVSTKTVTTETIAPDGQVTKQIVRTRESKPKDTPPAGGENALPKN